MNDKELSANVMSQDLILWMLKYVLQQQQMESSN